MGTLFIAIVKDPDGFEICLVSSETFDKAVLAAADWVGPDWEKRAVLEATRRAEAALKRRKDAAAGLVGALGGEAISVFSDSSVGTPLGERASLVAAHVVAAFKGEVDFSKTEGNFLTFGLASGFAAVAMVRALSRDQ